MKIIAQSKPFEKSKAIGCLLMMGVWDYMSPDERLAFCERGEVWDTSPGRFIFDRIKKMAPSSAETKEKE